MAHDPLQPELFPDQLFLKRIDPETNMRRFYMMTVQRDLFGQSALVTEYGRIGQAGRVQVAYLEDEAQALGALADKADAKRRRGYQE